jgi:hypothetical protein
MMIQGRAAKAFLFALCFLAFLYSIVHFFYTKHFRSNIKLANLFALSDLSYLASAQAVTYQNLSSSNLRVDTGQTGPAVEEVHYYND